MGLNQSMQKIISYTQKINNALNPDNWLSVKIPGKGLGKIFGREEDEGEVTVAQLMEDLNTLSGDVMTGWNLIRCLDMGKSGYAGLVAQLGMGVMGAVAAVADEIMDAIYIQISNAVNQIFDVINSLIDVFFNLWCTIYQIVQSIVDFFKSLGDFGKLQMKAALDKENCKDMYAAIGACLLNKFLGPYLEEFKEKAVNEINKGGAKLNDLVYEELSDVRTFTAYANQELFLLKKANYQIQGLTKDNLLQDLTIGQ